MKISSKIKLVIAAVLLLIISTVNSYAQGINFETRLSFEQILAKAKAENKYVFVDCYATWCVPCRAMDQQIYPNDTVGNYMNAHFICVKVQIDKTPNDSEGIKAWYGAAKYLKTTYSITALPTFLFFSPDGKPVNKSTGAELTATNFLQVASDALDSDKQFYNVKNNFQPGKLDTAKERELITAMSKVDFDLAARIAADYLSRIPKEQLGTPANAELMVQAQDNPDAMKVIADFLTDVTNSNSINELTVELMGHLADHKEIQQIVESYLVNINDENLGNYLNTNLLISFQKDSTINKIAKGYISRWPEDSLYSKFKIGLITPYLTLPGDRGFKEFFEHGDKIDARIHQKGFASDKVQRVISKAELDPKLDAAKQSMVMPDFNFIQSEIKRNYNEYYATRIIAEGKLAWYAFLINDKKQEQYWPQLISARVPEFELYRPDTVKKAFAGNMSVNNLVYSEFFLHCNDKAYLNKAVLWMKNVVSFNPEATNDLDTYASILYKAGYKAQALAVEQKALSIALRNKDEYNRNAFSKTLLKMRNGEKIWLEKEYQN